MLCKYCFTCSKHRCLLRNRGCRYGADNVTNKDKK
nr:MAG TPA: hypothetical protein [Caudoviricetes sp.]